MFHVAPIGALLYAMARDPALRLDYLRLVHGEHGMRFHRLLRPGDRLRVAGVLRSLEDKPSGRVATFDLTGDVDDGPAFAGWTTFFIRGEGGGGGGAKKPPPEDPGPPTFEADQPVAPDQAVRYAEASGDRNPIHLDEAVARKAGLPGCILHGLCTMAFAQRDLVRVACDGDPARLASISVRWVKPVLIGETLRLSAWGAGGTWQFVTRNAKAEPVVANGRAEVR
jgi:acyl dehydratase